MIGEQYGDSTQLLYLRARHYSPADGRFTSRDTWSGDYNRPLSLNRWMYVEGNPVNLVDPTGKNPLVRFEGENGARNWEQVEKDTIERVAWDIAKVYAATFNNELRRRLIKNCGPTYGMYFMDWMQISPTIAFTTIHRGGIKFLRKAEERGWWGFAYSQTEIFVYNNVTSGMIERNPRFIVHEIGHSFESALHSEFRNDTRFFEQGQYNVGRLGIMQVKIMAALPGALEIGNIAGMMVHIIQRETQMGVARFLQICLLAGYITIGKDRALEKGGALRARLGQHI